MNQYQYRSKIIPLVEKNQQLHADGKIDKRQNQYLQEKNLVNENLFDVKWLNKVDAILEYINSELSETNFNNSDFHRYLYEKKICLIDIDVPRFLEYQIDKKESLTISQQALLE